MAHKYSEKPLTEHVLFIEEILFVLLSITNLSQVNIFFSLEMLRLTHSSLYLYINEAAR